MDFISLANDQHNMLRRLDQMLGDDDTYDPAATTTTAIATDGGFVAPSAGKPFLSPQAGAELHLLATNFLLYTAMVIIVVVICKAYFPEWLESRDVVRQPRKFDYRVAEEQDYFDDDDDDDEEEDEDDEKESSDTNNNDDDYFRFQPETMSRQQVMQRLILCTILLNITFVTWGALQERMLTRRYPRYTGDYFTYSYALVFTNRFWTLLFSTVLWVWFRPRRSQTAVIYEYSFPSISNMLSSWCQYEALRYVSFPATTLFKSFKLAPVMLMGKVLGNKSYPQYEYGVALAIGIGICMFMTSTDDLNFETALRSDFQHDYLNREVGTAWTGVMLLCFFLLFDSFTSQFQSRMFQRHQDLSIIELMLATSAFSTALSLITLVHTKELYPAWNFMMEHSEIHLHFLLFSLCSTIGQLFIFYTIKNFGAVVFAFMMTLRVLLSIALSCVMYGHKVSATGFFGLIMVLGAALYRVRKKAEGKQLIKWQGMEDTTKAFDLLHEWHEHVDM